MECLTVMAEQAAMAQGYQARDASCSEKTDGADDASALQLRNDSVGDFLPHMMWGRS
jgi:hypothetical protein